MTYLHALDFFNAIIEVAGNAIDALASVLTKTGRRRRRLEKAHYLTRY